MAAVSTAGHGVARHSQAPEPKKKASWCCWCFAQPAPRSPRKATGHQGEQGSLLTKYGVAEMSDDEEDNEYTTNPMSPDEIALMLDRQIALTREIEIDIDKPPSEASAAQQQPPLAPKPG